MFENRRTWFNLRAFFRGDESVKVSGSFGACYIDYRLKPSRHRLKYLSPVPLG